MPKNIKFKTNPLRLVGRNLKTGMPAANFKVYSQDLKEVRLFDFKGKIKVITSFPSLDTPVCDLQVKEFNRRALNLSQEVVVLGISMDLPFAQKRFCEMNEIKNVLVFSDYRFSSFGLNYGLLIKDLGLLARSIIIVDKNNVIRYIQLVEELTQPPEYEEALSELSKVISTPSVEIKEEFPGQCKPCEGQISALAKEKVEQLLAQCRNWQLVEDKKITKEFKFDDYQEAKYFLDLISIIAAEQNHHPTLTLTYNKLKVILTTHAAKGLTENDFIMAKIIDDLAE